MSNHSRSPFLFSISCFLFIFIVFEFALPEHFVVLVLIEFRFFLFAPEGAVVADGDHFVGDFFHARHVGMGEVVGHFPMARSVPSPAARAVPNSGG